MSQQVNIALPMAESPPRPKGSLEGIGNPEEVSAIVTEWLNRFQELLHKARDEDGKSGLGPDDLRSAIQNLFLEKGYWRDLVCLSWNFRTLSGVNRIATFLHEENNRLKHIKSLNLEERSGFRAPRNFPLDPEGPVMGIQAFLNIELDFGAEAMGVVRLGRDEDGTWKVWTLSTVLQKFKGHGVRAGPERPLHHEYGAQPGRKYWGSTRAMELNMEDQDPVALIVGAGHCGLAIAAHLTHMGIRTLVIEQNARVGDNWRKRYGNLVLHDPVYMDNMPYMPFPSTWPVYTPKEKFADFLESYVTLLDINVWTSSKISNVAYNEANKTWSVTVERGIGTGNTQRRVIHPKHIVQTTGLASKPRLPTNIPGYHDFVGKDGRGIIHSTAVGEDAAAGPGVNVVIVGTGNSANDIAQRCWENGAEVTLIQRGSSFVFRRDTNAAQLFQPLYSETSPSNEDSDFLFMSNPFAIMRRMGVFRTKELAIKDAELLDGLKAVGFQLNSGPDGSGLLGVVAERRRGYVNDTGCMALVAQKKIKLESGNISRITRQSVILESGKEIQADLLIMCTGFYDVSHTTEDVLGPKIASKVGKVFDLDEEGEYNGLWRPTGHEGFWIGGQPISFARFYSKLLALQIQGIELGLNVKL